jgi:hypothetical protein
MALIMIQMFSVIKMASLTGTTVAASFIVENPFDCGYCLADRFGAGFAGTDADALFEFGNENLAVADGTGSCACDNRIDAGLYKFIVYGNLQADFLEQVYFGHDAAETLVVAFLLTAAKNVCNGHLENTSLV